MYVRIIRSQYFRDENMETLERAAEEKQKIHASMKEADERVKEMASTIAALKVRDIHMHMILCLHYKGRPGDEDICVHRAHNVPFPLPGVYSSARCRRQRPSGSACTASGIIECNSNFLFSC